MFKWLRHRLKKRSRYSSSEYRSVGDSSDHNLYDNHIEVATEAAEVETENGSMSKDDAQILKVNHIAHTEQHFAQVPQVLELSDNFQDQNCVISDIGRGTFEYECNKLSSEPYNQIAELSKHKVEILLPSQKQENDILSEAQDIHNFPRMEDKMTLGTLTVNRPDFSQEKEECETPLQAQDNEILPDSQDSELPSEAHEVLISTSVVIENIASSFKAQTHFNAQKGEAVDSKDNLPNLERICTQNEEWGSQESGVHRVKNIESTLEDSNVECIDNSDFVSLELSKQFIEIRDSIANQSVGINNEKIFTSHPKLKKDGGNTEMPFNDKKQGLISKNDFLEMKTEIFNQCNASVSVKSSSGTENSLDFLEFDNQSVQYNEILMEESSARYIKAEMKTEYMPSNSEHQLSPECRKKLELSNNLAVGERDSYPQPCFLQLTCLYNQPGKLCSVLGEQYILTHVESTPVLVNIRIENSNNAPFGCLFLWREGKPVVLAELPEGTGIYFDAVVMPDTAKFIAIVLWQVTKPLLSIEPYFNSYVFVEEMKEVLVQLISFGKKNGVISATIGSKAQLVTFSKSVVFIGGKKAQNKADIEKLSKCCSQHLLANVCKFVSIDNTGKVTYGFMCSCLWSGCKPPQANQTPVLNHFMLYKKDEIFYVEGKQQLHLYCDVDAELILNENGLCLVYERDDEDIIIPCTQKNIHCGNKSIVNVAGGSVKAHIRKQVSKSGKPVWTVLLIQVPEMVLPKVQETRTTNMYEWEAAAMGVCSDRMLRKEITSVESALNGGAQMVGETVEQRMKLDADIVQVDNLELEPLMEVSQLQVVPSYDMSKISGPEATISVEGRDIELVDKAALLISNKSMENNLEDLTLVKTGKDKSETIPVHSRVQSNDNSYSEMKEGEKKPTNFSISDKLESFNQTDKVRSYTHFSESEYNCKPKEYPKVLKNYYGKLHWINDSKMFRIYTKLHGSPYEVHLGSRAWMVANGILVTVEKNTSGLPVCFDIYFDDCLPHGHHLVALWVGEKPQKAVKNKNVTYLYDIHGVYHGYDGCDMKFLVSLDDCIIPIKTPTTNRVFTAEGMHCKSLPLRASVVLHLRKSIDEVSNQVHWQALLIVQADQEYSVLEPLVNTQHDLVPTWPASHSTAHQPLSNLTDDSNGNHLWENIELRNQNWMQQSCYASIKDLPLYIKNFAGMLMLNEHDKIAIFSCLDGTALWTSVSKNSFVCVGGRTVKMKEIPLGTGLMFDAFCYNPSKFEYTAVVIWIGSRPHYAEDTDGTMYFYNVKGTYCGVTDCNYEFEMLLLLNGEIQNIRCQKTGYIILPDGSMGLRKLTGSDKLCVHLKQKLHLNQYLWIILFIFIDENPSHPSESCQKILNEEKISEMKSCTLNGPTISQGYLQSESDLKKIVIEDYENISIGAESVGITEHVSITKEDTKALIDENTSAGLFSVLEGKIKTLNSSECKFTYTYEGNTRTLYLPTDIALDHPSCADSVIMFYLMTQKYSAEKITYHHPICGWFHKRTCEVYVIHCFEIESYDLGKQLISLMNPHARGLNYFLCVTKYLYLGKTKLPIEKVINTSNVHAVVKDIAPCVIAGIPVHRSILFLTTNKDLSLASLKFLALAEVDNEFGKVDLDNDSDSEVVDMEHQLLRRDLYCAQEDCQYVELEQTRTTTCKDKTGNSYFEEKSQLDGNINDSPEAEIQLEHNESADTEQKVYLSSGEEKTHLREKVDPSHRDENQYEDTNTLCGETLRQLIAKRSSEALAMNYISRYSTLEGNIHHELSGTSVFEWDGEPKIIHLPSDIHLLNCRISENHSEKCNLLVYQENDKNTEELIYHPLAVWHVGKTCDPFILFNQKVYLFDLQNELIGINNGQGYGFQYYSFKNKCAFTRKSVKSIGDFLNLVKDKSLSFYTVVEDIPPVFISGYYVNMHILLITTSQSLALASIDTITCNIGNNRLVSPDLNYELSKLLQKYEERRSCARQCKRGCSYHFYGNTFDIEHDMKLAGGCLESYSGEYGFILCDKKNIYALCHLSNVYYKGESITAWNDIDRIFWENFLTVICPLEKTIKTHGRNVSALVVVAWSCCEPGLLTVHGCDLHDPTLFVYNDTTSLDNETAEVLYSLNNKFPGELSPGLSSLRSSEECPNISAEELEALDCMAGSNIFSMHDKILQSCGLQRTFGKIKYFGKYLLVCTSELDEMVWCHLSDFYIENTGCKSIEDLIKHKKQKWCLIVLHSPSVVFLGKKIHLKAVVGFFKSEEKLPGIHICSDHNGILLNSIKGEKLAVAKQIFSDIQQICEQSDECAEYLLENIWNSREEHACLSADMKTTSHTECQGVFVSVHGTDPNKGMVNIQYQGKEHYVPVLRQVFHGLSRGLSLHAIIGCFLRVMIGFSESSERGKENFRVVMAWIDYNYLPNFPQNLANMVKVCSPSLRGKKACCSRAFVIQHFESVFKTSIFEVLLGYKISSDHENNLLFKCSQGVDNLLVACKKESLMRPDDSVDDDECPWHLLVHLPAKGNLCAEVQDGVGAWKGNATDFVVLICDVHRIQLVDLNFLEESKKDKNIFLKWLPSTVVNCNSSLVKNKSKSDPAINIVQAFSSTSANHSPWSHRSFPGVLNSTSLLKECIETNSFRYMKNFGCSKSLVDLGSQQKIHSPTTRSPKEYEDLTVSSQFTTEETVYTDKAFEGKDKQYDIIGIAGRTDEEFSEIHLPKTSAGIPTQTVESAESDMKIEKDPDQSFVGHSILYVESSKFEVLNEYQGIIISSGMTILVRNQRLYVNMLIPKEPLTEVIKKEEKVKVQAVVVPLLSPIIFMGYTVTHKAVVAWLGTKPWEVKRLVKRYQDSHGLHENVPELEDPSISTEDERCQEKLGERDKEQKFLQVISDAPQTLRGCIFVDSNAIFGILRSGTDYILFLQKLVYSKKQEIKAQSNMKSALILKLKQPVDILDCQVTYIALLVWTGRMPKDLENIIKDSLDFYRKEWTVELHEVQHRNISGISAKPATTQQIEEYHEDNDILKQSVKDIAQDFPGRSQIWDMKKTVSLEEKESNKCSDTNGGKIEVIFKDVSKFKHVTCGILLVLDDFAVLQTQSKFAIARREDFYFGDSKILSSLSLLEQLKNVHSVGAFVTGITKPVYVQQFTITYFALLAFSDKIPKAAENILAIWKGQDVKEVNLTQKIELKPILKTELTPSYFLRIKGKRFETNTACIHKLMKSSGILEVQNKEFEREKVRVFFSREHMYIDKKAIPEDEPLSEHIAHLIDEPWGCIARQFRKKNQASPRKIASVEVQYLAVLVWYGEKPTKKNMQSELVENSTMQSELVENSTMQSELVENSTKQKSMEVAEYQASVHPESEGKSVVKKVAVPSSRKESVIIERKSSNPEINKAESVVERLRRQMHSIQEDFHLEDHPTLRAKQKAGKSSDSSWSSEEKTGTRKGCITELCGLLGRLHLEDGDHFYFSREKCFLYGICLKKVELSHILSVGMDVDYELTDDGTDVKNIWAGSTVSLNPSSLLSKLREWCEAESVPKATADLLLTDAVWLSPELDPTIDFGEEKEVVDLS